MKKTKKILSLLTALTITASAFAGLAIPVNAEPDPAGVIDFTNRTLEATEKGNSTTFQVTDAADAGATGLAAAGAGNVLKIGSSASGGGKYLGYTAPLLVKDGNVTEYSEQVKLSFKVEPIQVRNDKDATVNLQFSDITKQNPIFPITVHVGDTAKFDINGETVAAEYGKYYVFEETLDFTSKTGTITVKDSAGTELLSNSSATLTASNLAYLYFENTDWRYGNFAIDDIALDATQIGTPVYYTATINTTRYAKLVTSDEKTYYADVNGKLEIPLLKPNTTFTYTLSKEGYTSVEGEISVTDSDVTQDKPLTIADDSILFIESEFGNANEAYVSPGGNRNDSISIGSYTLPAMPMISVDFNFAGFGGQAGQQKTWDIETDGGKLVGIQISDNGLYVWTGWTGTANMNQQADTDQFSQGVKLGDVPSGDFTLDFVVSTTDKNITVSYGDVSKSLTYAIDATAITGMATGLYRYNGQLSTKKITVTEPDPNFVTVAGISGVAKVSGQTIKREYKTSCTVVIPDEVFVWTVKDAAGNDVTGVTIDENGVLSVADTATPGEVIIKAVSASNPDKAASMTVTIGDFQELKVTADGPMAYNITDTEGIYKVVSTIDSFNDDVVDLVAPVWTSSNTNVAEIDAATGKLTVKGAGETTVKVTITNGTAVSTAEIPVKVAKYYATVKATGNSTEVDTTGLVTEGSTGLLVTTAKDGVMVNQTVIPANSAETASVKTMSAVTYTTPVDAVKITAAYGSELVLAGVTVEELKAGDTVEIDNEIAGARVFVWDSLKSMKPVTLTPSSPSATDAPQPTSMTVDTTGADDVEIAPIFETSMNKTVAVPADRYDVTATVSNGRRSDLYVNDQLLINNLNQGSDNYTVQRVIPASADYDADDIVIPEGYARFNYRDDQSGGTLITKVKFVKAPSIVTRAKRVYVIGDSLTAKYYGDAPEGQEGLVRTGWGQPLENYMAEGIRVTNLGNSGAWATGMLSDAFTQVKTSAKVGDVVLWESGYNDKSHSTVDAMNGAITEAVNWCKANNITIYLITPNASAHDYNGSVAWSAQMRTLAETLETPLIDLAKDSYDFLNAKYGTDTTQIVKYYNNSGDTLHSTYNAANCWAAVVATGMYNIEGTKDYVDTEHTYTFTDDTNTITVQVGKMN